MKVQTAAAAEIADTASGGSGSGFQGLWLPVKLESLKTPDIYRPGISGPPHILSRPDENVDGNGDRQDALFLGGILTLYGRTREGSITLSRAQIKGIHIDAWA
ncbi:MAG TPA: hypothetical protein P5551_07775 [Syntrophales bacterium]|jgi:hypothetical protein|nr:hypothetical protein [Syntrophales bacterium]HRT62241.1 hypothetical protein [Syntrophales bacterium]